MKVCTDACVFGAFVAEQLHGDYPADMLDVGCGTGLLSLMVAQKTDAAINAIEINEDAANQATANVEASPWKERVKVFKIALQKMSKQRQYDVIISNPPFFEQDLKSSEQQKNDAKHDTSLTLAELVSGIDVHLKPGGSAFVLLPYHRSKFFETIANQRSLFINKKLILRQTPGHQPFRSIVVLSKKEAETTVREMCIHDKDRQYTDAFKILLRDYYLYL